MEDELSNNEFNIFEITKKVLFLIFSIGFKKQFSMSLKEYK